VVWGGRPARWWRKAGNLEALAALGTRPSQAVGAMAMATMGLGWGQEGRAPAKP